MEKPNTSNTTPTLIPIEVIYALPQEQVLLTARVPEGSTLAEGIKASKVLERYPELALDLAQLKVGIFSKLATLETVLKARDRIEIYRPLIADPKEVRKQRAAEGKKMKRGNADSESSEG
ncbi:RnfH family protein [Thiofilum flexile]|uniref:RnfH family protein n=1 Tax=Thiofilum flexile TaxID=125627 RepID=UPI000377E401|nr:RnfH family protein [Thiofilum flexile]